MGAPIAQCMKQAALSPREINTGLFFETLGKSTLECSLNDRTRHCLSPDLSLSSW
jgi:hypothetical protein